MLIPRKIPGNLQSDSRVLFEKIQIKVNSQTAISKSVLEN